MLKGYCGGCGLKKDLIVDALGVSPNNESCERCGSRDWDLFGDELAKLNEKEARDADYE